MKHTKTIQTKPIPCRKAFTETLLGLAEKDKNIMVVTSDARGSVTLNDFAQKLPDQFVETGIAEQNAVGIGAGLASCGKKVFVCGPACFYSSRSLEQIKVDVAYSQNQVKIIGVSGGVSYGALGSTHHSLHDIAVMRAIPDLAVVLPCDQHQTRLLTQKLIDFNMAAYVRMGRAAVPDVYKNTDFDFEIGKANLLKHGNDITLIGTGETVFHCLKAAENLEHEGILARVLDMHSIKPLDTQAIIDAAKQTQAIITVEEHSIHGGLGAAVAEVVVQHHPVPVKIIAVPDQFAVHGNSPELFEYYGLNAKHITKKAIELFQKIQEQ